MCRVTFLNEKGVQVTRSFSSPYLAKKFANRIKYSKKCTLLSIEGAY